MDSQLSSNTMRPCASPKARMTSSAAGLPRMDTGTIMRVRGVSACFEL